MRNNLIKSPDKNIECDADEQGKIVFTFRNLGIWRKLYLAVNGVFALILLLMPLLVFSKSGVPGAVYFTVISIPVLGLAYSYWVYRSVVGRQVDSLLVLISINILNPINALLLLLIRITSKRELENPELLKNKTGRYSKAALERKERKNVASYSSRPADGTHSFGTSKKPINAKIPKHKTLIGIGILTFLAVAIIGYMLIQKNAIDQLLGPRILATELNPNDPYAWGSLAAEAYHSGRLSLAEDAAKEAIRCGPNGYSSGYLWLGRIYRDKRKYQEAIYCYQRSSSPWAKSELGDLHQSQGNHGQARDQYLRAVDILQSSTKEADVYYSPWNHLGDVYLKLGEQESAHKAFVEALTYAPDSESIQEKVKQTE